MSNQKPTAEQVSGVLNHLRSYAKAYAIGITSIAALGATLWSGKPPGPVKDLAKNTLESTLGVGKDQEDMKKDIEQLKQELTKQRVFFENEMKLIRSESRNYTLSLMFDIATKKRFKDLRDRLVETDDSVDVET